MPTSKKQITRQINTFSELPNEDVVIVRNITNLETLNPLCNIECEISCHAEKGIG